MNMYILPVQPYNQSTYKCCRVYLSSTDDFPSRKNLKAIPRPKELVTTAAKTQQPQPEPPRKSTRGKGKMRKGKRGKRGGTAHEMARRQDRKDDGTELKAIREEAFSRASDSLYERCKRPEAGGNYPELWY
jgi:hypothetical protein